MPDETPRKDPSGAPGDETSAPPPPASHAAGGGTGVPVPAPAPPPDDEVDDSPTGHLGGGGRPGDIAGPPEDEPVPPGKGDGPEPGPAGSDAGEKAGGSGGSGGDAGTPAVPAVVGETTAVGTPTTGGDTVPDPAHDIEQRKREAGADQRFPFGRPGQPLGRAHPFVFGFTAALGVITAWLLVRAATNAQSVIVMILVAMFLAVGLNPAVDRLRKIGLPRGAAVAMVFLAVILFFAGFVASLVQPVSEQVTELRENIPKYVTQMQDNKQLAEWDKRYGLLERAEKTVNSEGFQDRLTKMATGIGKGAVSGVFQTLTILILTLYFLSSLPQIKTFFYQLAPRSRRARVALLGDEILDRIGGYVAGQFTIAFIAGLTSYVFLQVMGVKYALALALIVAVTDLIPLVGATIGAVVVVLVAFLTGTYEGIAALIFYVLYQQVENYLVYPRVMKRTVDVQPAVTVVAALIGGTLLGVVGALLAIPTAAAISLLIREVVVPRQETL